jgi:hypothetical protein
LRNKGLTKEEKKLVERKRFRQKEVNILPRNRNLALKG